MQRASRSLRGRRTQALSLTLQRPWLGLLTPMPPFPYPGHMQPQLLPRSPSSWPSHLWGVNMGPVGFFQWIFAWQPHLLRSCCGVWGGPWMDLTLRRLHLEAGERRNYVDGCTRSARPLPHAHTEAPWWRRSHCQGRCPFGKGLVT